jgi:hypothetical protein
MLDSQLKKLPPIDGGTPRAYRLVVGAWAIGTKKYGWRIVRDDADHIVVRQPVLPFRSLSEAYEAGMIALRQFRDEIEKPRPAQFGKAN